ncbi:MAG: Gfo/Idh/MocA family oxidoreductase [Puniceicoccales bacterium]|jgi:predicted dehydrogenase|nr:Gfo/Idh/MocA family oxidoreductase [Puniceicoccales bacterium]
MSNPIISLGGNSRRNFLSGCAAVGGLTLLSSLPVNAFAQSGQKTLKVGVVGCGGRGQGAAGDILNASKHTGIPVEIYAVGDVFPHATNGIAKRNKIPAERVFNGFDNYKGVINSGIDIVILATPPGFRPLHIAYAVQKGVNIFAEKPFATDAAGINTVIAAAALAKEKKLAIVAGTQRRHQRVYVETMKRIHDGIIGKLTGAQVYWNGGGIWFRNPNPKWTEIENQANNWYHYDWLSGDNIVEQHLHNLDVMNWAFNTHPTGAYAMGGRQVRNTAGDIWDHFAVEFTFPGDVRTLSFCRHWPRTDDAVSEKIVGEKGVASPGAGHIRDHDGKTLFDFKSWARENKNYTGHHNAYVNEHVDLLKSIVAGEPLNEGKVVAESTFDAIIGREAAYSGRRLKWDAALASNFSLVPNGGEGITRDTPAPVPVIPQPGSWYLGKKIGKK